MLLIRRVFGIIIITSGSASGRDFVVVSGSSCCCCFLNFINTYWRRCTDTRIIAGIGGGVAVGGGIDCCLRDAGRWHDRDAGRCCCAGSLLLNVFQGSYCRLMAGCHVRASVVIPEIKYKITAKFHFPMNIMKTKQVFITKGNKCQNSVTTSTSCDENQTRELK